MFHRSAFDAPSPQASPSGWSGAAQAEHDETGQRRSWIGTLAVLLIALAGGLGAAWLCVENGVESRREELAESLTRSANALTRNTLDSAAIGALIVTGLNEPTFKQAVRGERPPDAPEVLERLAVARERFGAEAAILVSADGVVVAHQGGGPASATGLNVAYRPYLARALEGVESVYAASGAANASAVNLIFAAPLYEGTSAAGRVIGALLLTMPLSSIEQTVFAPGQERLLLSPQGIALLSSRPEWRFAVAPPLDAEKLAQIRGGRQFGARFDQTAPSALPFDPRQGEVRLEGAGMLVARERVEWNDPGGAWQLVGLQSAAHAVPLTEPIGFGAAAFLGIAMFGLMFLTLLGNRRRNAEIQARLSTLGSALERSATSVIVTDARGIIDWVNPNFERSSQYSVAELRGKAFQSLSGELTPPETRREMSSALRQGRPWSGEFVNRRKDGSVFREHASLSPVLGADGKCIGVVGLHEDITEIALARDRIAERERLLDKVFESSPDAILLVDAQGTIMEVNRAAETMFGHGRETLVGRGVEMLLSERSRRTLAAERESFAAALSNAAEEHRPTLYGLRASGGEFPIEPRLAPLSPRSPQSATAAGNRFVVSVRDVTLRGEIDRRLAEAMQQQAAILEHAPPIVFACDGLFRKVNGSFARLFGFSAEAMPGRPTSILFESPDSYAAFSADVAPALTRGETVRAEWRLRCANGGTIVARIRGQAVAMEGGGLGAVWVIEPLSGTVSSRAASLDAQ
ncbi:MAG: PAS domain S-box protein [Burkholderiales bacterium]